MSPSLVPRAAPSPAQATATHFLGEPVLLPRSEPPRARLFVISRRSPIAAMPDVVEPRFTAPAELLDLAPGPRPSFLQRTERRLTRAELRSKARQRIAERMLYACCGAGVLGAVVGLLHLSGRL